MKPFLISLTILLLAGLLIYLIFSHRFIDIKARMRKLPVSIKVKRLESDGNFRLNAENAVRFSAYEEKNQRWMDFGDQPYNDEFIKNFSYTNSEVWIQTVDDSDSFKGRIEAKGLKPNFVYQIKLAGHPDDWEHFEEIGYKGRWLLSNRGDETNFSDEEYQALSETEKRDVESYIFFDFLSVMKTAVQYMILN